MIRRYLDPRMWYYRWQERKLRKMWEDMYAFVDSCSCYECMWGFGD